MLQNYNTYRILQVFFDSPRKVFHLRQISRETGISLPSVVNHVKKLEKEGFVTTVREGSYNFYHANRDNERYKLYKKMDLMLRLNESGLIEYIVSKYVPVVIVLFGSGSRGEDTLSSDIDLFVAAREEKISRFDSGKNLKRKIDSVIEKKLSLNTFEKKLKTKINPFFEEKVENLSKELLNNVANGIVLYGYLKVV